MDMWLISQGKTTGANQKPPPPLLYTNRSKTLDERERNVRLAMIFSCMLIMMSQRSHVLQERKCLLRGCETLLFERYAHIQTS